MKLPIFVILMLTQTGCATWLREFRPRPKTQPYFLYGDSETDQMMIQAQKRNASKWAEWDKKYVSDDVIQVEIVEIKPK